MKVIKIDELIHLSNKYTNFSCKPSCKKYKEGTVFDEEKSVRWNKEEVKKRNDFYQEQLNNLNRIKNEMYKDLSNLIKQYIIQETKVSDKQATKIYDYLYEES